MDYNDTYAGEFSYHNITRSQISIDKYNGQSNRVEIPEKISGQEVIEIGEGAFFYNLNAARLDGMVLKKRRPYFRVRIVLRNQLELERAAEK